MSGSHRRGSGPRRILLRVLAGAGVVAVCLMAAREGRTARAEQEADARIYMAQALAALSPPPPCLVVVAGASGTGKTTLARRLAPGLGALPGAVHLRSDLERKALAGVDPLTHLPPEAYTAQATQDVYDRLFGRAETLLGAGQSVILDATFWDPAERLAAEDLAARLGAPFTGLWLTAPQDLLQDRVTARHGDASDADASVVALQMERGAGAVDWAELDAGQKLDTLVSAAQAVLQSNQASQPS